MQNAGFLRHIAAMLYDALLVGALLFLATIPFIAARGGEPVERGDNLVYQVTLLIVIYAFFVGFWSGPGRTLGMQSWRLQLLNDKGEVPTVAQASLRLLASLLSWLPLGLGFLWRLWDSEKLTWHDRISHTRLVYFPREKKPG